MRVCFLNDFLPHEMQGGSSLTTDLLMQKGMERKYIVTVHTPKTIRCNQDLHNFDLLILSNISYFPEETIKFIIDEKLPYVKHEHDYGFCKYRGGACDVCNNKCAAPQIYIDIFSNSKLNIFFSPLQLAIHRKFFGETLRDAMTIPAPIKKGMFFPEQEKQQKIFLYAGMLMTHKGIHQILDYADANPDKTFHFAGKAIYPNILERIKAKHTYLGEIPHEEMPALLRKYKYFIINPQMPETFSLSLLEAMMSGCEIIKFERSYGTGLESYHLPLAEMVKKCEEAPDTFWDAIEKVMGE